VKPHELSDLLLEFYRDKLALVLRHEEGARFISHYDFNNTYQYILSREETQLAWVGAAITDLGGRVPDEVETPAIPTGKGAARQRDILEADSRAAQGFVDRWSDRVDGMTNARHRLMLRVILGETLEQKRFFDQALAGRVDLLGRHADGAGTRGSVLPTRWIE
jgi:hypothetical protein